MRTTSGRRRVIPRPKHDYEYVEGWGMAVGSAARVWRPESVAEVVAAYRAARADGVPLGLRGSGCSYGDASVNAAGHVLELSRLNRILAFDPATGVAECEAGVTIEQLWKAILPHGFWPRVVSGTMFPTLGGALSMNIHGKNNFAVGTIGDAVREFDIVLPSGELRTCSREREADLFHAAIGGLGLLGTFVRVVLETKRVFSGDLEVRAKSTASLVEAMRYFEAHQETSDYLVAWIDCFARGAELGRGLVHDARYLARGEDEHPERTLTLAHQDLPKNILGVVPKGEMWRALRLLNHDFGMRSLNLAKYLAGQIEERQGPVRQAHAAFAFLLDYVPNWKWAYGRSEKRGLIQYQAFMPKETALAVYSEILRRNQAARIVPYLGVLKRHRPDPFWLTHSSDGWSLALDYKVTPHTRADLWRHCAELTRLVLAGGGKFYFAKDLVIGREDMVAMFPPDKLAAFVALKRTVDPENLLETDLSRRVMRGLL
ncbi:MAG: FAD-binding oxidoreductase [Planctomycetes bacterium]|nr:FAD-binding oxidoreductase [Planctomycetota bacterium]